MSVELRLAGAGSARSGIFGSSVYTLDAEVLGCAEHARTRSDWHGERAAMAGRCAREACARGRFCNLSVEEVDGAAH